MQEKHANLLTIGRRRKTTRNPVVSDVTRDSYPLDHAISPPKNQHVYVGMFSREMRQILFRLRSFARSMGINAIRQNPPKQPFVTPFSSEDDQLQINTAIWSRVHFVGEDSEG